MKEKQYDKAIRIYKKLIELNPKKAADYASVAHTCTVSRGIWTGRSNTTGCR